MNFESAPFKLTQEFIDVMGGLDSSVFAVCLGGGKRRWKREGERKRGRGVKKRAIQLIVLLLLLLLSY